MANTAPVAPNSFFDPALSTMKTALELTDVISGQLVLLSAVPANIEAAWAEAGVANDSTVAGVNVGTLVLGYAPIGTITGPVDGDIEAGTTDETGRKLQFAAVADVPVLENANASAVCMALVKGSATFATGNDTDVMYILDIQDIAIDGTPTGVTVNVPAAEIEILYGVNKV